MRIIVALLLALSAVPARAEQMSVEEAVSYAVKNNIGLFNAQQSRDAMEEKVREYWGGIYPAVNLTSSYTRNFELQSIYFDGRQIPMGADNSYALNLGLSQVVWAGGKVRTGIHIAEIYSASAQQQVRQTEMLLSKTVRNLCYNIVLASATAVIEEENLRIASEHLDQIRARYKQGLSSDLEELRQDVEVSNALPPVTKARNLLDTGLLTLKKTLAMDSERPLALSLAELPSAGDGDLDAFYKAAAGNRPELISARLQCRMAKEQIQLARSEFYPYVSAFAARQYQGQTNSSFPDGQQGTWSTNAGLQLNISLYAGGSSKSRVRQAEIAKVQAEKTLEDTERSIRIDVKRAWLNLKEARQRLEAQEGGVGQARKALKAVETRFQNGLSSQLELNDASLALNRAQLLRVEALRDVYVYLADLKWACGQ
ncbi:MAG: TolC family protein [Elusimicrobiales bacterium]